MNEFKNKNFLDVVSLALQKYPGNLIEIGCGFGTTTVPLLEIARKYNKLVIGIDPFEKAKSIAPKSYVDPYPKEIFLENTKNYSNLIFKQNFISDVELKEDIQKYVPISFAFIDGLQFKHSVLEDLEFIKNLNTNIIGLDDMNRLTDISQVPLAVNEFIQTNNYYILEGTEHQRVVFLIRKDLK